MKFLTIFRKFATIFQGFPKIFQNSKIVPKVRRTFPNIFGHFPKITEDFRKFLKISKEAPMMFRSQSNISKYFLRDYVTIAMVIILVTMATPISSHVKDKKSMFTACFEDMIF